MSPSEKMTEGSFSLPHTHSLICSNATLWTSDLRTRLYFEYGVVVCVDDVSWVVSTPRAPVPVSLHLEALKLRPN